MPTLKSNQTLVMIWEAFTGFNKSHLIILPQGQRSATDFVQNMYEGRFSGFYFMHNNPHELILMEDGALVHHSKLPEDWKQAHGIQKLVWPPNSPDLNPTENLWKILKDLLRHHNMPRNKQELINTIQKYEMKYP